MKWFAPILSFTTEEIYQLISKDNKSIHLEKFIIFPKKFENTKLSEKWRRLLQIRDVCNLSIEEKRSSKEIGSSLEASLLIKLKKDDLEIVKGIDLSELCITSSVKIENSASEDIQITTKKAKGEKCPVCWKISQEPCERHGKNS
tara:strand:- start:115 stop:549 length:435 start_codon:yes stop_codon:yes gene_type:complete